MRSITMADRRKQGYNQLRSGSGSEADMRLWAVMWVIGAGCAASKSDEDRSGVGMSAAEEGSAGDDLDEGGFDVEDPVAWELAGQVVLDTDVIVEDESVLRIRLLTDEREVLCESTAVIETATAMDASQYPEDTLVGWWRFFVEGPKPDGCFAEEYDFPVPVPMLLGIGPMHPEIIAAVGADPDLGSVDSLNGVYASMDGGETIWVFGVIGTDAAYDGTAGPEDSAPLSDGVWSIEPVYSFPL